MRWLFLTPAGGAGEGVMWRTARKVTNAHGPMKEKEEHGGGTLLRRAQEVDEEEDRTKDKREYRRSWPHDPAINQGYARLSRHTSPMRVSCQLGLMSGGG